MLLHARQEIDRPARSASRVFDEVRFLVGEPFVLETL
jgi:hypothetical protein